MKKRSDVTPASLRKVVKAFKDKRILVVGDIMVDCYLQGQVARISPEAPVPVVTVDSEARRLGGAANVAHNISALGGEALLCGRVGDDYDGRWLLEELGASGIDAGGVFVEPGIPTTVKTRLVAHNQQIVRFDRESLGMPSKDLGEQVASFIGKIWKSIDGAVISDYGKGVVTDEVMDRMRSVNSRGGKRPVAVDPKSTFFELYRNMTVITPNLKEAIAAAAVPQERDRYIERVGENLLKKTKASALLMTRGEDGMTLFEKGEGPFHIPTVAREVYDVTGAGDTVIGTLSLALAAGSTFREAAFLANLAAGIVVGEFGTVPAARKQLLEAVPRKIEL